MNRLREEHVALLSILVRERVGKEAIDMVRKRLGDFDLAYRRGYRYLQELEESGLVSSRRSDDEDRRRAWFQVTNAGMAAARDYFDRAASMQSWAALDLKGRLGQ